MKKTRGMGQILEQLENFSNVSVACKKTGISRNTFYKWLKENSEFETLVNKAMASGKDSINDLAENKLVGLINQGNLKAITYWLDNNKYDYIKPRSKNFWKDIEGLGKVTGINLTIVDSTDEIDRLDKLNKELDAKLKKKL